MLRSALVLSLVTTLASCSDSKPAPTADGPLADRGPGEGGLLEGPRPERRGDLGPDAPRPPARWELVPGPAIEVEEHTATLLASGDVLVVGGVHLSPDNQTEEVRAEAFRFSFAKGTIESAGKLATARSAHSASLLADGRVLVAGGEDAAGWLASTELYDPATGTWSPGPELPESLSGHAALSLPGGKVMISGGCIGAGQSGVYLYDPGLKDWTVSAALQEKRCAHTATLLKNGKVVLAGGLSGTGRTSTKWSDTLEVYDPKSGVSVLSSARMSQPRSGHTGTALQDGRVLFIGTWCGSACTGSSKDDVYEVATDKVSTLGHWGDPPLAHSAALLADGRVLVVGDTSRPERSVIFVPSGSVGSWLKGPNLNLPRWATRAVTLPDGSVLAVGGTSSTSPRTYPAQAERFYP